MKPASIFLFPLLLASLLSVAGCSNEQPPSISGGSPERGKLAIENRGCVSCHRIPGIAGTGSNVGPSLDQIAKRDYLGGVIANTPESMVRWLRDPPAVDPRTAMPNMGIGEAEAKDIAAYLYTLD